MFYANDKDNKRTSAWSANRDIPFFCPVCKSPVVLRDGLTNAPHFAHRAGTCTDTWHYDMSEWHRKMQSFFPESMQEVVVTHDGETHRADILYKNTVIEFQHSTISKNEFERRNDFFESLGYRIAWVFDVNDQRLNDQLIFYSEENPNLMKWSHAPKIFENCQSLYDKNRHFSIWLFWDVEGLDTFAKVTWTATNDYGGLSFKRITVSERTFDTDYITVDDFFHTKEQANERKKEILLLYINELGKNYTYNVKYSGVKGKSKDSYVCPKSKKFGISINNCRRCPCCYMVISQNYDENSYRHASYCCFPQTVNRSEEHNDLAPKYYYD